MLEALSSFLTSLGKFIPRLHIVRKTERAVLFRRGRIAKVVEPGLVLYWPLVTDIVWASVVKQTIDLPNLTLMSKDNKTVIASGLVVYEISDIYKYLVENYDCDKSISEIACAAIRDVIVDKTVDEIQGNNRNTIDTALSKNCREALKEYGIQVNRVRLTNFSVARVINILGLGTDTRQVPDKQTE